MVMVFNRNKKRISSRNNGEGNMEMEEYQARIELLSEIAEEASSITEVSTLLERILKVTQHTLGTKVTTLFLNDETKSELHSPFSIRNYEGAPHRRAAAIELEVAKWVANNVKPILINNVGADSRFNKYSDSTVSTIVAAPILRGKKVIGVISSNDKEDGSDFTERDFEVIKGFASTEALILLVSMQITAIDNFSRLALDQALLDGYRSTAEELATTADIKDSFGYAHSRRCKEYALLAANCLSLPPQEVKAIEFGALLHDIGKIGIDSDILCKPGPLTDEEWNIMFEHSRKGADILGEIPYLKEARDIVLYHHERYDGKGYPEKLTGEEIPLGARIVAVANAFDSMTTDRSYRTALSVDEAITELIDGIGTQFCPRATEAFISAFKKREDQLPFDRNHEDLKAMVDKEVEVLTIQAPKNEMDLTIEEEREAREQKAKAEKEAREQQARAEKEAKEQRARAEKEAKKQRARAEKEAKKQQARAEKEAREQQARADKEAKEQQARAEKEAREQQARAEKEAREQQARAEKEAKEQQTVDDKEAKKQQARAEKEAREQQTVDDKEDKAQQSITDKEAKKRQARAEKEAKEHQTVDDKENKAQQSIANKEAKKQQARDEEEAKEQQVIDEIEAKENKKPAPVQKTTDGKIDTEMFHGDIRLVVPITADIVEVRRFRKELERVEGVRIVMFGSSEGDGHMFILSLPEPIALVQAVKEIGSVENVGKKGKDIQVTLRNGNS
jgi:putative nucleotidyltransferase with HDIG domain